MVNGTLDRVSAETGEIEEDEEYDSYPGSDGIIRNLEAQAIEVLKTEARIGNRDKAGANTTLTKRVLVGHQFYDMTITVKVDLKVVVFKEKG